MIIKKNRIYGLDILRTGAIFFVMFSHGAVYTDKLVHVKYYRFMLWDGVGIFFVLSGFLIGNILIKLIEEKIFDSKALWQFWIRRWLRTIPAYFLVLSILAVSYFVVHQYLPPMLFKYYVFTQCFASPHPIFFFEAWSLSIEEWFYMIIPFLLFVSLKACHSKKYGILAIILVVLLIGTIIRTIKVMQKDNMIDDTFSLEVMKQVITRMDSIMYGVLGAWMAFYKTRFWLRYKNKLFMFGIVVMLLAVILIPYSTLFYGYYYCSITALATLCLLPALASINSGTGFVYKCITFVSVISYSMYLTNHMIVQRGLLVLLNDYIKLNLESNRMDNFIMLVCYWGFTIVSALILYTFCERPILNWREQLRN